VQGKTPEEAGRIREGALALEKAGCFALLLELVAAPLAHEITDMLQIPTIGIGSGVQCSGQVLVYNDLLGIFNRFKPRFVRHYKELRLEMINGCSRFISDVKTGKYPSRAESYS
jgi:3-methyl-2-oxobutanoate hydroxymethyltransferase